MYIQKKNSEHATIRLLFLGTIKKQIGYHSSTQVSILDENCAQCRN